MHTTHELGAAAHEHLAKEVILSIEEGVHRPHGELRQFGNLPEGRIVEPLLAEDPLGRIKKLTSAQVLTLGPALFTAAVVVVSSQWSTQWEPTRRANAGTQRPIPSNLSTPLQFPRVRIRLIPKFELQFKILQVKFKPNYGPAIVAGSRPVSTGCPPPLVV